MRLLTIPKVAAFLVAALAPMAAAAKPVSIATGEYEPFVSSTEADGGIVNNLITHVFNHAGYTAEYRFMPWKRALELTRRGEFDASSFWYFKEERKSEFFHAGPLFNDRLVFFRIKTETPFVWETLSDLRGLTVGVVDGYTYTPELWELGREGVMTLEPAPSDEANLKKLLAGRIDLFPVSEPTGRRILNTAFSPEQRAKIELVEKPLSVAVAYLLISKTIEDAETIAADFNAAIEDLREDDALPGVIDALSTR